MNTTILFLHGLDSSGQGTKGRWFGTHFPEMVIRDFTGTLDQRLDQLRHLCRNKEKLVLVGSSFGGLMATCYARDYPEKCSRLILLAPALNFEEFSPPLKKIQTPTRIIIGEHDTVTPPSLVLPLAKQSFAEAEISLVDDDHMLHTTFFVLDWKTMLRG